MFTITIVETADQQGKRSYATFLTTRAIGGGESATLLIRTTEKVDSGTLSFVLDDAQKLADSLDGDVTILTPDDRPGEEVLNYLALA